MYPSQENHGGSDQKPKPGKIIINNHDSLAPTFSNRFLKALATIQSKNTSKHRSGKMIKLASDISLASAVTPKKAWSRAILERFQLHLKHGRALKRVTVLNKKKKQEVCRGVESISRPDKLRGLVPGGERMDYCTLLEETADYIKCLETQVKAMADIVKSLCP
ncbi:hypothetical protein AMTR_s00005p00155460 [Amborella trichopoda]|uniref:IBH1-like N-terminal domain-containing protein n=2 Tax=Amborella trichopoda TaxID=13333 RepID=W1PFQ1_AMBTC|nr:hypothetical protein AMTR_s00005p00155460 [Amborella trichopoda]